MQRAAFAAGTTTIEGGPLLIGENVAIITSHRFEVLAAKGEGPSAIAVGQQTEVADLDEAGRQHVQQETTEELNRIEAHGTLLLTVEPEHDYRLSQISQTVPRTAQGRG